jgi:hypothetical protein
MYCRKAVPRADRSRVWWLEAAALPVAAVHSDDGGLVTIGVGIRAGSTECLGSVRGESPDMLGMETVAEHMADYVVGDPDDARRRQDGIGRRCHPPPRRQYACLHDDNRPVSLQRDSRGEFSCG